MPNLFVATGIFHPEPGGPATYLQEILPALQARGWQVRLLTYGASTKNTYPYAVQRVPRRVYPVRLTQYALKAVQPLRWADIAYLHTIDLPLPTSRRVPRVIKIVGDQAWERCIRKGWIPPTTDIDDFQTMRTGGIVGQQQASRAEQVRSMAAVIVPSDYLKQMVMGWGVPEARIHRIYNALPALHDAEVSTVAVERPTVPTLFTAARLAPWKGVDHIIQALKRVPDVHLVVAGDGPDRERLQTLAAELGERVRFLGRVSRADVYQQMRAAHYTVLYSGYEGLPHTLLESLRLGTPVIASDKGGNPEVVQHAQNGLLVPYVDVDALAAVFQQAFSGATQARLAAGTANGLERFDFGQMVQQTHAVLSHYI